jgi:hypothetical protein
MAHDEKKVSLSSVNKNFSYEEIISSDVFIHASAINTALPEAGYCKKMPN